MAKECMRHTDTAYSPAAWGHYGPKHSGWTVVPVSSVMTRWQIMLILDFKPSAFLVRSSYLLNELKQLRKMHHGSHCCSLTVGIFDAEP